MKLTNVNEKMDRSSNKNHKENQSTKRKNKKSFHQMVDFNGKYDESIMSYNSPPLNSNRSNIS
jgi:hypothetical protein